MRTLLAAPWLTAAALIPWISPLAPAQCGLWDPAIGTPGMSQGGVAATPTVACSVVFDDGLGPKLYAGGHFGAASGVNVNYVARWDGANWTALGSGLDGPALSMAVFDDGTGAALYVGGQFALAGGVPAIGLAKWDGSGWSAVSSPGLSSSAAVHAMLASSVGGVNSLFIAGSFSQAGGQTVNNVARWDGSSWHALGVAPNIGMLQLASALATYDFDGPGPQPPKLVVGGYFTKAGPVSVNRIAAWDGTAWSALGNGVQSGSTSVRALAVHDEGAGPQLFVAGQFTAADGGALPAKNIARWDGSAWSAVGDGFDAAAAALAVHDDGAGAALVAGGYFAASGNGLTPLRYVARWTGGTWQALGLGIDTSNGIVHTLCSYADAIGPALCAGGAFVSVNGGRISNRIATWRGTTSALSYCTAKLNSLGCTPAIGWTGTASATATSGFVVRATQIRNNKNGLLFYSTSGRAATPYQGGTLCTKAQIKRTPSVNSGGTPPPANDCSGVFQLDMNAFARGLLGGVPVAALSIPGTLVDAQWWGRDPGFPAPDNTTLSNAVEYLVCP